MADPYLGEIRPFAFGYAPKGWALCNGALLSIQQNAALYSLLGNTFGGDGRTTFALPDLRGRTPLHPDPAQQQQRGTIGGAEQVTLLPTQVPPHTHSVIASGTNADRSGAAGATPCFLGATVAGSSYAPASGATLTPLDASAVGSIGGGQAHNNMQPSLVINFCIATTGAYPPRPD
jgi:microcystin-dependent protein